MSGSAEGAGPGADLAAWGDELYTLGEAQLPAWARDRKSKGPGDEDKRAPIEDVISALAAIPNDDGWDVPATWDEWSRIGMAVWGATGGSDEGLLAWTLWSERCEFKHDPAACEERWDHWTVSSPPTDIGIGALIIAAKEATGGRWRRPSRSPEVEFEKEEEPGDAQPGEGAAPFRALLERVAYIIGVAGSICGTAGS
jgi:hypothetical protein